MPRKFRRAGSLAVWHNRCLLRHAIADYPDFRRVRLRTTIAGDRWLERYLVVGLTAGARK